MADGEFAVPTPSRQMWSNSSCSRVSRSRSEAQSAGRHRKETQQRSHQERRAAPEGANSVRKRTGIRSNRKRKKYFKLYETDAVDDDLFVERLSELKEKQEQIARLREQTERQLADNTSDPIPLQQVRQALSHSKACLARHPQITQKTLLQTVVKQIHVKNRRKVEGIELEFDPKVQKHFFELAPFAKTAEGAFAFHKQKSPSKYIIVFDPKKARRSPRALEYFLKCDRCQTPTTQHALQWLLHGSLQKNLPLLMVRFPPIYLHRPINLLHQHQPHQLMRQGHAPEAQLLLGALQHRGREPVAPANNKSHVASPIRG